MKCQRCSSESPDEKVFCGDCGFPLAPGIAYLEEKIDQKVEKEISSRFKDQRLVALDTSDIVLNRITSQAKTYLWLSGGIVTLILLGISIAGVKKYNDFSSLVREAETKVRPKLDAAKHEANEAEQEANDAKRAATQAKLDIQKTSGEVQSELKKASGITSQVQTLSERVSDLEKQTTHKFTDANQHVATQMSDLDAKVATALADISKQQTKLANTDELVEALFSKGEVELFPIADSPRLVVLPLGDHVAVYALLKEPPIFQTSLLQWHIFLQPKNSYLFVSNVMIFRWGQSLDALKQNPLIISYVPNPRHQAIFKQLTIKEGSVYADGQKLPLI